ELAGPVFSFGCYVAAVEIDRPTEKVTLHKVVAVDDCGRVVNPLLAEGQVVGAAIQAVGECLFEQVGYDEDGQPLAVNLYEYHLPAALSVPPVVGELRETPSSEEPRVGKEGGTRWSAAQPTNAGHA